MEFDDVRVDNDPDQTAARVAAVMSEQDLFSKHLGIELAALRPGYSKAVLTLAPHMVNPLGMPHGAVIFALADFAFGAASNSHGQAAVALSVDIHFLSSPRVGSKITVEAVEVRRGRRTGLYRMAVSDENGGAVAELHGMAYLKNGNFLEGS
jgi:acyl-CoA thioesterase